MPAGRRNRYAPPAPPPAEFVPWKPEVCEEPGCTARHPSFSRDGMKGPWRCAEHDRTATKRKDGFGPLL